MPRSRAAADRARRADGAGAAARAGAHRAAAVGEGHRDRRASARRSASPSTRGGRARGGLRQPAAGRLAAAAPAPAWCSSSRSGAVPTVLFDGIVTETELTPGDRPGSATFDGRPARTSPTSWTWRSATSSTPALDDHLQVLADPGALRGARDPAAGVPAAATGPAAADRADAHPARRPTCVHLAALAARNGYVAYVIPGPVPGASSFYWGPPVRVGLPQPALSVDLGAETNVVSAPTFRTDARAPDAASTGERAGPAAPAEPCRCRPGPACGRRWPPCRCGRSDPTCARRRLRESGHRRRDRAGPGAGGQVDRASTRWSARARLDGARYGAVLRPRGLVGVRGAGWSHDGLWYVRRVVHDLAPGGRTGSSSCRSRGLRLHGHRSVVDMTAFFGKYRGHGRRQRRPACSAAGCRSRCPAVLGERPAELGRGRASRTPATRSGLFAVPPVGANVWVEFEAGDPDHPILGRLLLGAGPGPGRRACRRRRCSKTDGGDDHR